MSDNAPNLETIRHIREASDVGCADDGQQLLLNLRMEDGNTEWFAMHHAKVGRFIAAVLFGNTTAARDRATAAAGWKQSPELSTLIDILRINTSSAPGADHVGLRVAVAEGVNLDFRVPLSVVPALQEKLAQSLALAQGSK